MKLRKKESKIVGKAIDAWQSENVIGGDVADKLRASIEPLSFDWEKLAKQSFWIALICLFIAVSSAFADEMIRNFLAFFFHAPAYAKMLGGAVVAGLFFWRGLSVRRRFPSKVFSSEASLFLGVLTTGYSIYQLGVACDDGSGHISLLFLLATGIYAGLGLLFRSNLIWLFSLLSLGSWMGAETGYMSGWGAYYLGMNYPTRFAMLGAGLVVASFAMEKSAFFASVQRTTQGMGLLYLFVSLWIMSIFGNYGDMSSWSQSGPDDRLPWALLFGIAALIAIYHGLKDDNALTKGYGIVFLFINLYTRYFEYFWNGLHKAVFFAFLAVSFWMLGRHAENIWAYGEKRKGQS